MPKMGKARYRDYETDIDVRELISDLFRIHGGMEFSFGTAEEFDEWMIDYLSEGMDSTEGLLALFYRNLWAMADMRERLKNYEDKHEQGLLISLPCPVGTVIYIVNRYWHSVEVGDICGFSECDDVDCFCYKVYVDPDTYENIAIADFGVDWFLTEAEAEEALAKNGRFA